jgi:hypothetical protein
MSNQSTKTAKRSAKPAGRAVKKPAKSVKGAKSARVAEKSASKSARSPLGNMAETARALMGAARAASASKSAPKMIRTASPPVQPVADEIVLPRHKYQVGESVYYTSPTFGRAAASGSYTVVKLLPSEGDDYQYRIKSSGEAFERVAKESQLDKM